MNRTSALAYVLAGGEGSRLRPLTDELAKPALHFAHGHRIIDFVLGNLVNSRIPSIYVLAQYKPAALVEHIDRVWRSADVRQASRIEVILPEALGPGCAFRGTADAVRRCLHVLEDHDPEVVAVFAADHVYRMDVRPMIDLHLGRGADVTVAGNPVPLAEAPSFGIMATGPDGAILDFQEKPPVPAPIPGAPGHAYASMGNYLFRPGLLAPLLEEAARRGGTDFGRHVLPALPGSGLRAYAYDFAGGTLPGIRPWEEACYWRDVGTPDALAQARRDVEGSRPRFDLRNRHWPIRRDLTAHPNARAAA